jgi:hypothetical protein
MIDGIIKQPTCTINNLPIPDVSLYHFELDAIKLYKMYENTLNLVLYYISSYFFIYFL